MYCDSGCRRNRVRPDRTACDRAIQRCRTRENRTHQQLAETIECCLGAHEFQGDGRRRWRLRAVAGKYSPQTLDDELPDSPATEPLRFLRGKAREIARLVRNLQRFRRDNTPIELEYQVELPHTVYVLQKQPLEKSDISVESVHYLPNQSRVIVVLKNNSSKLGRAVEWQVSSKTAKMSSAGFPLLPQSRRRLELEWNSATPPNAFSVRFEHFTLREDLNEKRK